MQEFVQKLAVAAIVLAALVYAVWTFMPAQWRSRLAARLGLRQRGAANGCHASAACGGCRAACAVRREDP